MRGLRLFCEKLDTTAPKFEINYSESPQELALSFDIKIDDGAFGEVRQVIVHGNSPINTKKIQSIYRGMCLSFKHIFNALSLWSFACYLVSLSEKQPMNCKNGSRAWVMCALEFGFNKNGLIHMPKALRVIAEKKTYQTRNLVAWI